MIEALFFCENRRGISGYECEFECCAEYTRCELTKSVFQTRYPCPEVQNVPRTESVSGLMTEFYPNIKLVHVAAVIASGTLFLLRGVVQQTGGKWAMSAPLRYLSYSIDTVLLAAAIMLLTILPAALYVNGWLTLKIGLLVVYVLLGSFALKRGRSSRVRLHCFVAALFVYACMFMIARTHDPLGPFTYLQRLLT